MSKEKYNPFKHLYDTESLPPEHKESVIKTIDMIRLFGDITELFSVQQIKTDTDLIVNMIDSGESRKKQKNPPSNEQK